MNRRGFLAGLGAAALVWGAGCSDGGGGGAPAGTTRVRFVHAATGAANVDLLVDDASVVSNAAFSDVSRSGYFGVAAGRHSLQLRAAGAAEILAAAGVVFEDGKSYTAVATGRADNGSLAVRVLEDVERDTASPTLRLLHYAQNEVFALDAYLTAPAANLANRSPSRNLLFNTAADVIEAMPGTYELRVTRANQKAPILLDETGLSLTAGQKRTAVLFDSPGSGLALVLKFLP